MAAPLESCRLLRPDNVVATVGDKSLLRADVESSTAALTGPDSLAAATLFVDQWVRKQVMLQEADRVLASDLKSINAMVDDYRTSLLTNRLNQEYLQGRADSLITDSMVKAYYERHGSEFPIDRTIVKGRIVRLPSGYRQAQKLFTLMGSESAEKQKDFSDICAKNKFELYTFDSWTDFTDFLSYLPVRRGGNYDSMLSHRGVQQTSDADSKYYFEITEVIRQGGQAPLERTSDMVRRMMFARRSAEITRAYADSLYQAALLKGTINIKQ